MNPGYVLAIIVVLGGISLGIVGLTLEVKELRKAIQDYLKETPNAS